MFRTQVKIPVPDFQIDYQSRVLTLGSCFAENIGNKLTELWFPAFLNPFGVLYNPLSVGKALRILMSDKEFEEKDLFQHASLWGSFMHSTAFSAATAEETLQNINSRLLAARYFLQETDVLMITFGTAWIFELAEGGELVSNCHKLPADHFNRRRLSTGEIVGEMNEVFRQLLERRPNLKIILTVSPIRHWKDGAQENTVSKSTLQLAVNELTSSFEQVIYFPAFEIMMDELRDYRFYASDMLHPSDVAVDYIWKRFADTFFDEETEVLKQKLKQLRSDLNHRPLHGDTPEYRKFIENVEQRKISLIEAYPFLKMRIE